MYFDLIRLGIPQSALAFTFIGRGSCTPLQVGLYKNFQNKTKPNRITTGQTGLTGRPDRSDRLASELSELAVNKYILRRTTRSVHVLIVHRGALAVTMGASPNTGRPLQAYSSPHELCCTCTAVGQQGKKSTWAHVRVHQ